MCTDIDECTTGQDSCHSNATCSNNVGSYSCQCNSGFSGNGTVCTDIDECTTGQDSCHSNATCSNNVGSYSCQCNSGFSGSGRYCVGRYSEISGSFSLQVIMCDFKWRPLWLFNCPLKESVWVLFC